MVLNVPSSSSRRCGRLRESRKRVNAVPVSVSTRSADSMALLEVARRVSSSCSITLSRVGSMLASIISVIFRAKSSVPQAETTPSVTERISWSSDNAEVSVLSLRLISASLLVPRSQYVPKRMARAVVNRIRMTTVMSRIFVMMGLSLKAIILRILPGIQTGSSLSGS